MTPQGHLDWLVGQGCVPASEAGHAPFPAMTATFLNPSSTAVEVRITLFFSDREPLGPCVVTVEARRAVAVDFGDLDGPEPVPRDRLFVAAATSTHPFVVVGGFPLDAERQQLAALASHRPSADAKQPRSTAVRSSGAVHLCDPLPAPAG